MSERLSREELDKISARAKTAREALMWLIRNYGNAMARRQYHQVEAPMNDVPALLAHIAALEAENERLRAVAEAAKALIADPEWCSCSTINPNSRHAHDRPNLDYPATCAICGPTYCTGRTLNDALAALDEEAGE